MPVIPLQRPFEVRHLPPAADGTVCVAVAGEVDIANAHKLFGALVGKSDTAASTVRVDLTDVTFIDSTGLRALLTAYETLGGRLQVVPGPACVRLFELAGVHELLAPLLEEPRPAS